ncbi:MULTISPECIES: carboxymuconolactone decarboxylase family protein [unclassified Dyella]|uniref:carboxymuconolactone decarboxylase family protein n=1 Tax=unclassified Dyella TaxID=2634549 RepID=UPI000C852802|nr:MULTISPECIES: carboxymuconolactone decarboxylase family protein [unclassified Dyella]MDR3445762.1 carboxymuconolactone decarboxylase family protein [Dyella sp.]PMQ04272.1 Alkyl hydroperoxide reductase AhpD [Dyella sp. AD56]
MSKRLSFMKYPQAMKPLFDFSQASHQCGLERPLVDLVLMRVSQINGCAFCMDMHSKDARAAGETEQRLYLLSGWRETSIYSERECAALGWAEAVTRLGEHGVFDEVYDRTRAAFSEEELVNLTLIIGMINTWNRVNVAFRTPAGNYKPAAKQAA